MLSLNLSFTVQCIPVWGTYPQLLMGSNGKREFGLSVVALCGFFERCPPCVSLLSPVSPPLLAFLSSLQFLSDGACRHARRFWGVPLLHLLELVALC